MDKIKIQENRETFVIEMLKKYSPNSPSNILSDIGSGWGWLEKHALEMNLEWQPFDYLRKIESAKIWDLNQPAPAGVKAAGMCVMLEVLEHLPNPLLAIQHISEHLEPGAIMIMSVPNPSWSRNRLHLLQKGTLYAFQKKHLEEHHVFTPWRHIVEFFFEQSGFEVLEHHAIQQYDSKVKRVKGRIIQFLQKWIESKDSMSIGLSYGLVLRKKDI
jgi:2-polyprenyl-3-methyl-5-hydroxy-6-metoxy-1,4-benzoquinol methylase